MNELTQIVRGRLDKIRDISSSCSYQDFRGLKENESSRVFRENAILQGMRLNKAIPNSVKLEYFHSSLAIMRELNTDFEYEPPSDTKVMQQFLDCFVGLYKVFFKFFQQSMQFKTKLDSYIRATNHNVVTDLIKYLVDFTRDSYQHTFMWANRLKSEPKKRETTLDRLEKWEKVELLRQPVAKDSASVDTRPSWDCSVGVNNKIKLKSKKSTGSSSMYDLIGATFPVFGGLDASTNNAYFKIKVNELFKESRSRNITIKNAIEGFISKHNPKEKKNNIMVSKPSRRQEQLFPVQISLVTEKSGLQYLQIENVNPKKPGKSITLDILNKQYKPKSSILIQENKIQAILRKSSLVEGNITTLNSLKILRITDNTLPPIFLNKKYKPLDYTRDRDDFSSRQSPIAKKFDSTVKRVQQNSAQTQEKLIQWLGKIKTSKEQERKRLFGLEIK